jgi:DNA-binding transcriptional LysR family regulator
LQQAEAVIPSEITAVFFSGRKFKIQGAIDVELMQLEMFVAVVEERSVQKAADRVSRTQPAVSIALRKLEDQVGTPLLDRSCRRAFRLTPAGELLYEFASRMIATRDEALSVLRGEKHNCPGRLSVGASGVASLACVQQLTAKFRAAHPMVRIEVFSDEADKLLSEVADRKLDAAFLSALPAENQTSRGLVLDTLRSTGSRATLWLALPRAGRSHTLRMFGELVSLDWVPAAGVVLKAPANRPALYVPPSRVRMRSHSTCTAKKSCSPFQC